jgi:hypothetical protein
MPWPRSWGCRGRRPHRAQHPGGRRAAPDRSAALARRPAAPHGRIDPRGVAEEGAPLRQGRRGALQPDQRAPQVRPRLGSRRDALLAGPDARGGRGSALSRAAAREDGIGGHRAGRSSRPSRSRWRPRRHTTSSARPRGSSRWRRPPSTSPARRSRTPSTRPSARRARTSTRGPPSRSRFTFATPPRG